MSRLPEHTPEKFLSHKSKDFGLENILGASANIQRTIKRSENGKTLLEEKVSSRSMIGFRGHKDKDAFHSAPGNGIATGDLKKNLSFGSPTNVSNIVIDSDPKDRGENSRGRGTRSKRGIGRGIRACAGDRTERKTPDKIQTKSNIISKEQIKSVGSDRGKPKGGKYPNKRGDCSETGIGHRTLISESNHENALSCKFRDLEIETKQGAIKGASGDVNSRRKKGEKGKTFEGGINSKNIFVARCLEGKETFHSASGNERLTGDLKQKPSFGSPTNVSNIDKDSDPKDRGENSRGRGTRSKRGIGRGIRACAGDRTERKTPDKIQTKSNIISKEQIKSVGSDRGKPKGGKYPNKRGDCSETGIGHRTLISESNHENALSCKFRDLEIETKQGAIKGASGDVNSRRKKGEKGKTFEGGINSKNIFVARCLEGKETFHSASGNERLTGDLKQKPSFGSPTNVSNIDIDSDPKDRGENSRGRGTRSKRGIGRGIRVCAGDRTERKTPDKIQTKSNIISKDQIKSVGSDRSKPRDGKYLNKRGDCSETGIGHRTLIPERNQEQALEGVSSKSKVVTGGLEVKKTFHSVSENGRLTGDLKLTPKFESLTDVRDVENGPKDRGQNSRGRGTRGFRGSERGRGRGMRSRIGDRTERRGIMGSDRGRDGGGKFPNKMGNHPYTGIGYAILKSWSEIKDGEELLVQMSNKMDSIEELVMVHMKEDWYTLLTKSLNTAITCQHYSQKLKKILNIVGTSHYLTHDLTKYLDQKQKQGEDWTDAMGFINSILRIIQQIVKHLPECAQKCKFPLRVLLSMSYDLEAECSLQGLQGLISPVLLSVTEIGKAWDERQARKHLYLPCSDSDTPPEDFRELSVIPTVSDLFPDEEPFVRAIITKGAYKDQDHYLDIQFRLMREDFIKPLRKGIQDYRRNRHDKKFKSSEIRIYEDVHFTGITQVNGINHVLQFDVKNMKHVTWDHSKRLLTGNLVCLSNDNFESTIIFATVSLRKTEMLKKGIVNVVCHSGLDIVLKTSSSDTFILAETMAYYEAVNPILRGLQTIEFDIPLKEYIISCERKLRPPSYLLKGVRKYDISCLMKSPKSTKVSVLNTLSWPPEEHMCLNPSQREAAIQALTKEISIIQGPPGTGKTHVGLKVMQVLLENKDEMIRNEFSKHDPILVICYTNHALDQFLEGILQFCKKGIVRIGGKSSSNVLEPFNLMNLKKKGSRKWKRDLWMMHKRLEKYSKSICQLKEQIEQLTFNVLTDNILVKCMSAKHYRQLMSVETGRKSPKSMIHEWLNVSSNSLLQTLPVMIKNHLVKLVVKYIQLGVEMDINYVRFPTVSIVDRVKLYVYWLRGYQLNLKNYLDIIQSWTSVGITHLSHLYQQSHRPSILPDNEICTMIPPMIFAGIQEYLYKHTSKFTSDNGIIEAWVLGLHNTFSKQLDDVELLNNFIENNLSPEERDDFDDAEESNNIKHLRQDFEDEDDEAKNLKATLQVKNETTFVFNRAKRLGIREDVFDESQGREILEEDEDGFRKVTHKKHLTFAQVQKRLLDDRLLPVQENEEDLIYDLWSLDPKTRFSLYKLWIKRYMDQLVSQIEEIVQDYNDTKQELDKIRRKEDIDVLRSAKVIGMTTTGAAKKKALLEEIGCRIIIVEEAAEVLEAHIVTALNKNCKHLILIGDHQQLRPNPTVYDHAKKFGLDVSLFERLVNNDVPHITLGEQHRMRESISKVMRHIYPNLQDHVSVKKYDNIRGVSKNIFFIQHDQREECTNDSMSKSNPFEAQYLIRLCIYFLQQGYQPSQITILATYAGQVLTLKKEMKKKNIADGVRVTGVDSFQGEENDIILLSLVRSNENSNVGFLKVDNRVCVALSRAKKGMFAIGNIKQLASQSKLWEKILQTAQNEEITGDGLPLVCPNHPDKQNMIRIPQDFDKCPEGGCNEKCDFRLDCGHTCTRKCHGYDLDHKDFRCLAPCSKKCPEGHPCRKRCSQECGKCKRLVSKRIEACGHVNNYFCSKEPEETDCYSQCETILPCGHRCEGKCGKCKKNDEHGLCPVPVSYLWPCGHTVKVQCHFKPSENPCPKVCHEILNCGHKCKGTCSDCLNGSDHVACTHKCQKLLPCGHQCRSSCGIPCPPCSCLNDVLNGRNEINLPAYSRENRLVDASCLEDDFANKYANSSDQVLLLIKKMIAEGGSAVRG